MVSTIVISVLATLVVVQAFVLIHRNKKTDQTTTISQVPLVATPIVAQIPPNSSVHPDNAKYLNECKTLVHDAYLFFAAIMRASAFNCPLQEWITKRFEKIDEAQKIDIGHKTQFLLNLFSEDPMMLLPKLESHYSEMAEGTIQLVNNFINDVEKTYPHLQGKFSSSRLGEIEKARLAQIIKIKYAPALSAAQLVSQQQQKCSALLKNLKQHEGDDSEAQLLDMGMIAISAFTNPLLGIAKAAASYASNDKKTTARMHLEESFQSELHKLNTITNELSEFTEKAIQETRMLVGKALIDATDSFVAMIDVLSKTNISLKLLHSTLTSVDGLDAETRKNFGVIIESEIKDDPEVDHETYKRIKKLVQEAA